MQVRADLEAVDQDDADDNGQGDDQADGSFDFLGPVRAEACKQFLPEMFDVH
ncbi:MAG: hypothetical protein LUH17_03820 [Acidaminococcaceae bacterium]|nr:hypothetical protein [Acidaminococcaceae bacterium]